ncbi:2'-5' RNA ligase family protein [Oleiharenicola lentus]|uniref:2'-5' RNA ligase family protein n=1 Tax=Oleiharenicola lentus TaxID=2508720 RepID=UPI003F67D62B
MAVRRLTSVGQLSFGLSADSDATDYLFFSIYPEPPVPAKLSGHAQHLRSKHGLIGRPLAADRFHISLSDLGNYCGLPVGRVREAKEAASTVKASAFDVTFDNVMSFDHSSGNFPLVLRMATDTGPLIEFHQVLVTALVKAGLDVEARFTPHITLLYDVNLVPKEPIEPLHFKVNHFTLVHSLQGKTRHVKLGQWNLQG